MLSSGRWILSVILATAVLALCAGGPVRLMPREEAAMDCALRLCAGSGGCSATATPQFQTVTVAPLPGGCSIAGPIAEASGAPVVTSGAARCRAVRALPPRSPPLV